MGRGHCLCREGGRVKPARSKFESLFPEWLFRREKSLSKSQPRKPAIARETRSVARRDCATSALGSWPAVPSPAEPRLRAPSGGPARPRGQGPGSLISEVPALLQGQRRTPPGWSQDFTICKGIPRVASVRGLDMGGVTGGGRPLPLPVHPVPGSGLWEEAQLATPRKTGGASHCIPRKGAKFPRCPSALHRDHPPQHGLASP